MLRRVLFPLALLLLGCSPGGQFSATSSGWSPAVASDGAVYVGTKQGQVKALADKGFEGVQVSWTYPADGAEASILGVHSTPAVGQRLLYVSGIDGVLYAIDKETGRVGETGWRQPQGQVPDLKPLVGGPALDPEGKVVMVGSEDGNLYAYNAATGETLWSFKTNGKIWSTPAVRGDTVYFGSHDRHIYAVSLDDGKLKWKYPTGGVVAGRPLLFKNLVVAGSFDKTLYALDAGNGAMRWQFSGKNWFWAGAVSDGRTIFAPSMDGNIYALDGGGKLLWQQPLGSPIVSGPVLLPRGLVVASKDGKITVLDPSPGDIGQQRVLSSLSLRDTEIRAPLANAGNSVFVGAQDSTVRRIEVKTTQVQMWCFHTKKTQCEIH